MVNKINIQQLNADFGISNQLVFTKGKGGLPFIEVTNKKASALISIYAGQVLSFKPVNEAEDFMFISDNAYFQEGRAIKGGIPICWPWFGSALDTKNNKLPDHGFVRNNYWSVSAVDILDNGDTKIKLEFVDSAKTRKLWRYEFYLALEIIVGDSLTLELLTQNTGDKSFFITEALHTYFNVGDATQVQVLGLEKTEYLDKTEDFIKVCQIGALTISEETDHIHLGVKQDLTINDPAFNRNIKITSSGNKNVVVWNPWVKGSAEITDLESDDYRHFICVEIANVASDIVEILPDSEYRIVTNYSLA
ncbi:MAG: D-hexose-6-phosphate mutarotase [Methylococcales bacterium]|nr:D-hexose-6-phosphate mutarotase [Methylococcales bacterium]